MRGHIRKRGNSYQVIVYLGKVGDKKKYKTVTVQKEEEAEKLLVEILYKINTNQYIDPGKITFGEYLNKWLEDYCKHRLAPLTYHRYEEIIKLHLIPELGYIPLAKLQPLDIQSYYSQALKRGRIGRGKSKGLSPTTVLFHHRVIHKALEQAVKWQLLARNLADAVEPPKKAVIEYEVIDSKKLLEMLAYIKEKYPVIFIPMILAAFTGMRRGEVLGLRWKDINLKEKLIKIRQQIQRVDGEFVFRECKSRKSSRGILLSDELVGILRIYRKQSGKAFTDLVCCWWKGKPIDPSYFSHTFKKVAVKFGVPNLRLHDLRHSFATMLLEKNINLKKVSEYLGHSSIGITGDIYSHVTPTMGDEIAAVTGEVLKKVDCQGIVKKKK